MEAISIVVADDHPLVRDHIRAILSTDPAIVLIGEATSGNETRELCKEYRPDILLLDCALPDSQTLQVVDYIRQNYTAVKVLLLASGDDTCIREFVLLGVTGCVVKSKMHQTLLPAIRAVMHGHSWFSQKVIQRLLYQALHPHQPTSGVALTERERAIIRLLVEGRTNRSIGAVLGISEKAVEKNLSEVFAKLDVATRVEAAVKAVRYALV